jgi:hypothetical protein
MAYPAGRSSAVYAIGDGLTFDVPLPPHQADDVMYLSVQQDGGTGTISVSGWSEITTQAAHGGQRTALFRKVATSSAETTPTVTLTLDDDASATLILLRGANTTTPEHQTLRTNYTADASPAMGSVTTSQANCLVLWFVGYDNGLWRLSPIDPAAIQFGATAKNGAGCMAIGWTTQPSAGATPTPEMQFGATSAGTCITVAVADDGNGHMPPMLKDGVDFWKRVTHDNHVADGITWQVPSALAASTDVGGITLDTTDTIATTEIAGPPDSPYDTFTSATNNNPYAAGESRWAGVSFAVSSTNLTGKLVGLRFAPTTAAPAVFADPGFALVFEDGSGNWKAIQVATLTTALPATSDARVAVVDPSGAAAYDSAGTVDWTNITRVGILFIRRTTSTTTRAFAFRHLMLFDKPVFVGGSSAQPLRGSLLKDLLCGWLEDPYIQIQGQRQVMSRLPIQFGDGSTPTYVDTAGMALEPHPTRDDTYDNMPWVLGEDDFEFRIKASASDTMYVRSCVIGAGQRQRFVIDAASSSSADYDFAGLVLVDFAVEHNASGVTMNDVTFSRCEGIALSGGALSGCAIERSLATPAVTTDDLALITGCAFISDGDGHAIEITSPGTYTFSGNTFSGYGADGTTDAAIYNNSGGAVTINVAGGGDTPTVRNGTGASTTVNSGATLTLDGLVTGSDIVILDAGTSTERVNVDAHAGTIYGYNYTSGGAVDIGVFKVGYVPFYIRNFTLGSSDATLPIAQVVDRSYLNP